MYKKSILMLPIMSLMASGCASIISGTDQNITVDSNPKGAECILMRQDLELAKITTPETINVSKLKYDIYVTCNLEGFYESTAHVDSGSEGATFGNILLGGGIGWAIDSARGADNKYPEVVTITMVPLSEPAPAVEKIGVEAKPETSEENQGEEGTEPLMEDQPETPSVTEEAISPEKDPS